MTVGVPFSLVTLSSGKQEKVTRHQAELNYLIDWILAFARMTMWLGLKIEPTF